MICKHKPRKDQMKRRKQRLSTIEEDVSSLFEEHEMEELRQRSASVLGDDDEHTAILQPADKASFNRRIAEQQQRVGCLIVLAGSQAGKVLQLKEEENVVGRARDATLSLQGHGISRYHATIRHHRLSDHYTISDLDSKNGTFINGKAVEKKTTLNDGDLITLGGAFLLKFKKIERSYLKARTQDSISDIEGGLVQVSLDQRVIWYNEYAGELLGFDDRDEPHMHFRAALHYQIIKHPDQFSFEKGVEVWQTSIDHSLYRCHATPIFSEQRDAQGKPIVIGIANLFMDASLESMLEREISLVSQQLLVASQRANAARLAAESANQAKSEFLARMSHELRTPLNAIIGYAELMLEDASAEAQRSLDLGKIRSAGHHLLDLIDEVLDISRLEAGKMDVQLDMFAIEELIFLLGSMLEPVALKNNNTLHIECPPKLGKILSDRTKVQQILSNLLSNACKFTSDGNVWLRAKRVHHAGQDWYQVSVSDDGIGMDQEQVSRVFEAFYQAESSSTRRFQGTGLGLTICKKFCDLLGATIKVESEAGQGTTFTVLLPIQFPTPI